MYKGAKIENENKAQGERFGSPIQRNAGRGQAKLEGDTVTQYKWWKWGMVVGGMKCKANARHEYTCLAQAEQVWVSCTTHEAVGMRHVLKQQWLCTQRGTLWASYKLR